MTTVGRSDRTPAKHCLMYKLYAQEIGPAHYNPGIDELLWLDLTAGDGAVPTGAVWHENCSPGLLAFHARYPEWDTRNEVFTGRLLGTKPVRIELYEISRETYARLLGNLARELPDLGYTQLAETEWKCGPVSLRAHNISGKTADLSRITNRTAVRVNNDPNAIVDWAMPEEMPSDIRDITPWFLGICTMGCNVGGLKRILVERPEEADRWVDCVRSVVHGLPRYHDAYLCAIDGDAAQWAYLIIAPSPKLNDSRGRRVRHDWCLKVQRTASNCFSEQGLRLRGAWWRKDRDAFISIVDYLFTLKGK